MPELAVTQDPGQERVFRPSVRSFYRHRLPVLRRLLPLLLLGVVGLLARSHGETWVWVFLLAGVLGGMAYMVLYFRDVKIFVGPGYFGRSTTLGTRQVWPRSSLAGVVIRTVLQTTPAGDATGRLAYFLSPSGSALFKLEAEKWGDDTLRQIWQALELQPTEDSQPVSLADLARQIPGGASWLGANVRLLSVAGVIALTAAIILLVLLGVVQVKGAAGPA